MATATAADATVPLTGLVPDSERPWSCTIEEEATMPESTDPPVTPHPQSGGGGGSRGGRPPRSGHPSFAARDRRTGRVVGWADGQWSGDRLAVAAAQAACWARVEVPVTPHGPLVTADAGDPVAALAVIRSVLGGNLEYTGTLPHLPAPPPGLGR